MFLPLILLVNSNVDAMTENVLHNHGNAPLPTSTSNESSPRVAAAMEKTKPPTTVTFIDPTKFKSSWDMIMHFSKDYDSSVRNDNLLLTWTTAYHLESITQFCS